MAPQKPADDLIASILDSSPTGVVISTVDDGSILYVNDIMAGFFDISREEAKNRSTTSFFIDAADRAKVRDAITRHGEVRKYSVRTRSPKGVERMCIFSGRLITYQGKRSIITWLEDETERVRRELEMQSAARQVEMLHQIAGISNRAVNFYGALRAASAEIARCLGWPVCVVYRRAHGETELLQISSFSLPKDDPAYESLRSTLVGRSFHPGEDLPGRVFASRGLAWVEDVSADPGITRFMPDDPVRIVSALAMAITADDSVVAVLELLSPVRAPRDERMELTLAQVSAELGRVHLRDQMTMALQGARAEAESNTRAKASFLAAMSHEVRTPMNGVVGMVDLILQTKLDDDQRFMLQTVKESGYALIKVINDILDFSKIEAGRLEIEQAEFSVAKTLEEAAMSLAPLAAQKKLTLVTYADPRLPDTALGDAVRLRQILWNLGSNAVKFSQKGEVVIKAELQPPQEDGAVRVRFSVRDEGMGISPEVRARLFEEFQQADTSTTRQFGGTGLGLAICRRLTALMGGEIDVDSLVGVGSEFHCVLPFKPSPTKAEERLSMDLAGLRVLVLAESNELREMCRSYLSFWKAEVMTAAHMRECLKLLRTVKDNETPVDVVVIPHAGDPEQINALKDGLANANRKHFPRFVIGRGTHAETAEAFDLPDVTLLDVNPIRRAALISAVAIAAGRASPEAQTIERPEFEAEATPPSVEEALAQGKLILVAEDHIANREVVRRQLNRLGYACEIADDGVIALKMWNAKPYALLLTDCHMPNMDGFGLTAAIRKAEAGSGKHAPIIAITANVLQGEAERCLASGMDAFLPKPVDLKMLKSTLDKWIGGGSGGFHIKTPMARSAPAAADGPQVLDLTMMESVFGKIDDSVREFFELFVDSVKPLIGQFEDHMAASRLPEAREVIHKARGAAANAGGHELAALMREIEKALMDKNYDEAKRRSLEIQPAWQRLSEAITRV